MDDHAVQQDDLHTMLLGTDVPGSVVKVKVRKLNGSTVTVQLKRIATESIADRRKMFEHFTALKVDVPAYRTLHVRDVPAHLCSAMCLCIHPLILLRNEP